MHRKLYFSNLSPYARKVRIILAELDLDYQSDCLDRMRPVDLIGPLNPNLTVPVFEDRGLTLFDSSVIAEYLLDTYGACNEGLNSNVPLYLHVFRADNKWEDLKILASLETLTESLVSLFLYRGSIERAGLHSGEVDYLQRQQIRIEKILDWLDVRATEEGFVPGSFTLADISLIAALGMCDAVNLYDWRSCSRLGALVQCFSERRSVSTTSPAVE